ncbi:MAG: Trp biosynthesis-associated membrane protein [Propionibacteriales bacterium]|nr:Trp biosynthesis-associated membrane protein [Propionibacteriales bacterium]
MADGTTRASGSATADRAPGYGPTLVLGLVSAGATTVGMSRPWLSAAATVRGLPTIRAHVDGADLAPLAGALSVVLLAAFGAVIATRGGVRRALGGLVMACAVVILVAVVHPGDVGPAIEQGLSAKGWSGGDYHTSTLPWRWLVGVGGAGCLLAGSLVEIFGGGWATMSTRYDAPTSAERHRSAEPVDPSETDLWRSIDRGHDPTQTP